MGLYSARERKVLALLAETVIPGGRTLPAGGDATVARLDDALGVLPPWVTTALRSLIWAVELAPVVTTGRPFSALSAPRRTQYLERWYRASLPAQRQVLRVLLTALKGAHFHDEALRSRNECGANVTVATDENPRWLAQVTHGTEVTEDTTLEADVVVVGTGAGGAPLAYELALRGHAVVLLEEGRYHRRHEFTGHPAEMTRKLYRDAGMTVALGNVSAPIWAGCAVGGSTVINSGTCYRAPERVFRSWREQFGLGDFSGDAMDPYYTRVEQILGVEPARAQFLGGVARVVARGAERLGLRHTPLRRNAPDCDGQGMCCWGCPTGAKRSTDVSYVPMALARGAALFTESRVETVVTERGAARGVVARCAGGGRLTVMARATVVAGGTLMTPLLLEANGLGGASGQLGRNLSVHPASKVMALFDERIDMARAIPQGYAIDQYADEGIVFEGASLPMEIAAIALPFFGPLFTDVIERYRHLASFGFMIHDTSRGRVRRGPGGRPLIFYSLDDNDVSRMYRGVELLCEVFFEAGAARVFPSVHGFDELRSRTDLAALRGARRRAGDLDVSAYHPLGTARMGSDPRTSVVGPDHQVHDTRDLYVVDGSAIPSALGVNPQVTIMAMATRAAEILDRRLTVSPESSHPATAA